MTTVMFCIALCNAFAAGFSTAAVAVGGMDRRGGLVTGLVLIILNVVCAIVIFTLALNRFAAEL